DDPLDRDLPLSLCASDMVDEGLVGLSLLFEGVRDPVSVFRLSKNDGPELFFPPGYWIWTESRCHSSPADSGIARPGFGVYRRFFPSSQGSQMVSAGVRSSCLDHMPSVTLAVCLMASRPMCPSLMCHRG